MQRRCSADRCNVLHPELLQALDDQGLDLAAAGLWFPLPLGKLRKQTLDWKNVVGVENDIPVDVGVVGLAVRPIPMVSLEDFRYEAAAGEDPAPLPTLAQ